MGDTIAPSDVLANGLKTPNALEAAGQGMQFGQAMGAANALRGVDFSDPNSVDSAMSGLVRHGAIDQGNALANLNFTRNLRSQLPDIVKRIVSVAHGGQAAPAQDPGQPAQAPAQDPAQDPAQAQPASAQAPSAQAPPSLSPDQQLAAATDASRAIDYVSGLPPAERPGAIAEVQDHFSKTYGLAPAALSGAAQTLITGTPAEVAALKANADAHAHAMAVQTGHPAAVAAGLAQAPAAGQNPAAPGASSAAGAPPPTAPPPGGAPPPQATASGASQPVGSAMDGPDLWGKRILESPEALLGIGMAKSAGMDLSPVLEGAKTEAGPEIAQEAEVRNAAQKAGETARGQLPYGYQDLPVGDGSTVRVTGDVAQAVLRLPPYLQQLALQQLKQGSATQSTEAQATAQARGAGSQEMVSVPITDPVTGETRSQMVPRTALIDAQRSGQLAPGVGATPTDMQQQSNKNDVDLMGSTRAAVTPKSMTDHQAVIDNATAGLSFLKSGSVNPNDLTPYAQKIAGALNAVGIKNGSVDANNLAIYQRAANTALLSHSHDFAGRNTDKDLAIEQSVVPSLKTPRDAAAFAFATQAAVANRSLQWEKFVSSHPEVTSHKAMLAAFNNGPNFGSIYADPAFQGLTLNGKPAVVIAPPDKNGHVWGVFNGKQPFLVR